MATVTSKGQITIPADVRKALGLETGSVVDFVPTGHGTYEMVPRTTSIMDLAGALPHHGRPISIEEMNEGIAAAWAGETDE